MAAHDAWFSCLALERLLRTEPNVFIVDLLLIYQWFHLPFTFF